MSGTKSIANKKSCEAEAGRIDTTWNKMEILQEGFREVLISQGKTGWLRAADIGEGTKKLVTGGVAYVALAEAVSPVSKYLGGTFIADYMAGGFKQLEAGFGDYPGSGRDESGPLVEIAGDIHPIAGKITAIGEELYVFGKASQGIGKLVDGSGMTGTVGNEGGEVEL